MNPIQSPSQPPGLEEPTGHDDPLDALLTQIINGFFVLTDGQGAVSSGLSPRAAFGLLTSEALGKPLFARWSITHRRRRRVAALPWRTANRRARAPWQESARSTRRQAHLPDGDGLVRSSSRGFDFSLFLEDLSFRAPRNLIWRECARAPGRGAALRAALETEPQQWDGWRTAGTMVAFRPLAGDPWWPTARRPQAARERRHRGRSAWIPIPGIQATRSPTSMTPRRRPRLLSALGASRTREDRRRSARRARGGPPRGAGQPRPCRVR